MPPLSFEDWDKKKAEVAVMVIMAVKRAEKDVKTIKKKFSCFSCSGFQMMRHSLLLKSSAVDSDSG